MKHRLLMVIALTLLPACNRDRSDGPASAGAQPTPVASAKPGSYEDWCEEHAVPESLCTQCNPKLIPAFKATNDWCVEHAVPESQCRRCNPSLKIARPPKQ